MSRAILRCAMLLLTLALLPLLVGARASDAGAQTLVVDGPDGAVLPTITPRFTLRALGVSLSDPPVLFTLLISRNANVDGAFVETINRTTGDTVVSVMVSRLLPNGTPTNPISIYWKGRVTLRSGRVVESEITGPRRVPLWLTLISPIAGTYTTRRPPFVWQSAKIDPSFGTWQYEVQIFDKNAAGSELTVSQSDTTFIPQTDLQANTLYLWKVRATTSISNDAVVVQSQTTFSISDPSVPTTTLLYQNFPNPFPTPFSFSTCFWFDVKVGGARISLDIVDLRGSLVKRIIPLSDFAAGTYGRGGEGSGNNCNNLYVWNGTATDGRSVQGGVYLARFTATGSPPLIKKIVFKGR